MTSNNFSVIGQNGQPIINMEHPLHPGTLIDMEVETRGLKKKDVAKDLGIQPGHLSDLINEKRDVSAIIALKLEQLFGVEADFWLRVQNGYDLVKAKKKLAKKNSQKVTPV